jgi:uncharacterized protein YkwD
MPTKKPPRQIIYALRRQAPPEHAGEPNILAEAADALDELLHDNEKWWRTAERCKENYLVAMKENAQLRKHAHLSARPVMHFITDGNLTKLIKLHNDARANSSWFRPVRELLRSEALMEYAQHHAVKMASGGWLRHSTMANIKKLGFIEVGENIAWGQKTEEAVMKSWLWSWGHRGNILSSKYDSIGCGARKDRDGRIYWCVVFGKRQPRAKT